MHLDTVHPQTSSREKRSINFESTRLPLRVMKIWTRETILLLSQPIPIVSPVLNVVHGNLLMPSFVLIRSTPESELKAATVYHTENPSTILLNNMTVRDVGAKYIPRFFAPTYT